MPRLQGVYPVEYRKSVAIIALTCDCHFITGLGERSGVELFTGHACYKITWPDHPELDGKYIALTEDGYKPL